MVKLVVDYLINRRQSPKVHADSVHTKSLADSPRGLHRTPRGVHLDSVRPRGGSADYMWTSLTLGNTVKYQMYVGFLWAFFLVNIIIEFQKAWDLYGVRGAIFKNFQLINVSIVTAICTCSFQIFDFLVDYLLSALLRITNFALHG